MTTRRRTQAERRATTRAALVDAARALFAEHGIAATANDDIAARAGVTRGALYHHFESKADVAAAVIGDLDRELIARAIRAARRGATGLDRLRLSCRAYIDACAEPAVARIITEAPAVLSVDALRTMSERTGNEVLRAALADGLAVPGDLDVTAHLLVALLNEAAFIVAADPRARRRVRTTVDSFIERLFRVGG